MISGGPPFHGRWSVNSVYEAQLDARWLRTFAGYVAGGRTGSESPVNPVDKFSLSDDSRSTLSTGLSSNRFYAAGFASSTAGYVAGGREYNPYYSTVNTVDKFLLSNDSRSTLSTGLSEAKQAVTGFSSSTYGYVAGSYTDIDKFLFSNDSRVLLPNYSGRLGSTGFASSTAGYVAGGSVINSNRVTTVDKLLFSNDTRSTLSTGLSIANEDGTGFASVTAGYVFSGLLDNVNTILSINKFSFSNDSRSTLTLSTSDRRCEAAGFASSTAGYVAGGKTSYSSSPLSAVIKLLYDNELLYTLGTGLSQSRSAAAGFATP